MNGESMRAAAGRPADRVFIGYVLATGIVWLAFGWRLTPGLWLGITAAHASIAVLARAISRMPADGTSWVGFFRDAYPLVFVPFLYWELRHTARIFAPGFHDARIIALEQALFGEQLAMTFSQVFPVPWFSELMHLSYAMYWPLLPAALAALYLRGRLAGFRELIFVELVLFFSCYLVYTFFPVAGPFYEFPRIGGPLADGFFYGLVHGVLADGGSRGAAFPSSHVAVAVGVTMVAWRHDRRLFAITAPIVAGLILGTVYGRFHYAVDALGGLLFAWIGFPIALELSRLLGEGERPDDGGQPRRGAARLKGRSSEVT